MMQIEILLMAGYFQSIFCQRFYARIRSPHFVVKGAPVVALPSLFKVRLTFVHGDNHA
jgi:hypothetical protein